MKVWFPVLRTLNAFMQAIPDWECKTVGYLGERAKWHCGACTFNMIRTLVSYAYSFWSKDEKYKDALS